ncbi:MAG: transglutaminase domain-containing protein, partial [Deltaproteobacteria bacterium]|nr:transglutaminase domain-containing protein [Deltaproteobacteria bacterium]
EARARLLFEWARDALREEERAGVPRVLETLAARRGDCNEQSALLVTLYRAAGLPAEQVFGLLALGDRAGYHAWARVWLGGAWVEVDPARGLDRATPAHWALSAGDERAQERLRPLLGRLSARLLGWGR